MSEQNNFLQKIAFSGVRLTAFLLAIGTAVGAIKIATDMPPEMDSVLRWGLFGMMVVLCVLCTLMLFAPTKRKKNDD
jgi:hypothetical protein